MRSEKVDGILGMHKARITLKCISKNPYSISPSLLFTAAFLVCNPLHTPPPPPPSPPPLPKRTVNCTAILATNRHPPPQVMFLPTAFAHVVVETPAVAQGVLYSEWADAALANPGRREIGGNAWLGTATRKFDDVMSRPKACFDYEFYIMVRPTIPSVY
jgi:hypothetical protein